MRKTSVDGAQQLAGYRNASPWWKDAFEIIPKTWDETEENQNKSIPALGNTWSRNSLPGRNFDGFPAWKFSPDSFLWKRAFLLSGRREEIHQRAEKNIIRGRFMETFRNIIEYFALLMGAVMLVSLTNKQLQIFQQSQYRFRSFRKNLKVHISGEPFLALYSFILSPSLVHSAYFWNLSRHSALWNWRKAILKLKYTRG